MSAAPYAGQVAALASRHDKERAIAPAFRRCLQITLEVVAVDTDAFGTFAGEIPRTDTPLNTAIAKARAGMRESGRSLGVASEGTIGSDPLLPLVTSDIETIAFLDDDRDLIISETTRSTDIVAVRETVTPNSSLSRLLAIADFPRHALIVRPGGAAIDQPAGSARTPIIKGITDKRALKRAIDECSALDGSAVVESDLRACHSPSRMRNIRRCAQQLAERIARTCPECASPGWGRMTPVRGLPCAACGTNVDVAIRSDVYGCPSCPAYLEVPRAELSVEPRWCPFCNP